MRKLLSTLGMLFGFSVMYFGILFFVSNTSENTATKGSTFIAPVEAKLHFYEDENATHKYGDKYRSNGTGYDYDVKTYERINQKTGELWSSEAYPIPKKYKKLTIVNSVDKPSIKAIKKIAITITKKSH